MAALNPSSPIVFSIRVCFISCSRAPFMPPVRASPPSPGLMFVTWVIKDFKSLQHPITSPEFESGGCKWRVGVNPNANNSICVYLTVSDWGKLPRGWKIKAKFWLAIKSPYQRRATRDDPNYFDWYCPAWGVNLLDRSELDDGFLDDHGDLSIEAHVEVLFKSGLQTCCCGKGFRQHVR
ncbi:unnamed protein product [Microthlaspi erraticum]|uniref:MATH domain-containing protein n=1 Tax=Microthlaspi erraticum TaxID=1685480 RepID=A0A6D2HLQ1_9BRAS|nr:unnamed protein product [Microthlaspi erraticum]